MEKIRFVIIGASEIAYRRFMPALMKDPRFKYVGVAIEREQDILKAQAFKNEYGGEIIDGYSNAINRNDVDAVYVPQPPALHYKFGLEVLNAKKHLFMEKPFTTSLEETMQLIELGKRFNLAINENYMFRFHKQIKEFKRLSLNQDLIGKLLKYEVRFSFPQRAQNDFRYNKALGGGALFDCGGYTIMLSNYLLSGKGKITSFKSEYTNEFDVDIAGSGIMANDKKMTCAFSFGMCHDYYCYAKAFGDKGILVAPRVLTAPFDYDVNFELRNNDDQLIKTINIGCDDTFLKSINNFYNCIVDDKQRENNYNLIVEQSKLIEIVKGKR